MKIQKVLALEREMIAVARGEKRAPADAAKPGFNSTEALVRLLTPQNRRLFALFAIASLVPSRHRCR
jgi:predicted transcriptional regulator